MKINIYMVHQQLSVLKVGSKYPGGVSRVAIGGGQKRFSLHRLQLPYTQVMKCGKFYSLSDGNEKFSILATGGAAFGILESAKITLFAICGSTGRQNCKNLLRTDPEQNLSHFMN